MAIFGVFSLTLGAVFSLTLGQPVSHILQNYIRPGNTQTGQNQNSGAGPPTSTSGQSGQEASAASAVTALCNNDERRMVFRSCIMPYVQDHSGYIRYLSRQPACQAEVFRCSRTDQLVQCLNSLPISKVSNQCWPVVPGLLGSLFKLYRVPCTFDDVRKQCRDTVQDLVTAEKRSPPQASGLNGSPQQQGGVLDPAPQQDGGGSNNGPQLGSGINRPSQSRGGSNNSPQSGGEPTISLQSVLSGDSGPSENQTAQSNESAAALGLTPYCSRTEMNLVFQRCARSYGYAHFRYLNFIRSQPTCRAEFFSCEHTNQLMGCLNGLPVQQVSNNCWIMMPDVLTSFFKSYRLRCTFKDIEKQCNATSQSLLAVEKRSPPQASSLNGSPQQQGGVLNPAPQQDGGGSNNGPQMSSGINRPSQSRGGSNNSPQSEGDPTISLQSVLSGDSGPSENQTAHSNESAAALGLTPYCSRTEMNLVFQRCARSYGYAHFRYLNFIRSQPTCRAEFFSCEHTNQLMGCLNGLPVQQVSNNCWIMMPDVLTSFFKSYRLRCTFKDIEKQCNATSQSLLAVAKRVEQQSMGMGGSLQQPGGFNRTPQQGGMTNRLPQQGGTMNGMPQQGGTMNGMPQQGGTMNGMPQQGGTMNGMPQQGGTMNGTPKQGGTMNGMPQQGGTMNGMPQQSGAMNRAPQDGPIMNLMPLQGPVMNRVP